MVDLVARGFKDKVVILFDALVPGQLDLLVLIAHDLLLRAGPAVLLRRHVLELVVHDLLARFNAAH